MAHQVIWTKKTLDTFIKLGNLNEFQQQIMITRCNNKTVIEQSIMLNCSESKVHKEIARIKRIYDEVQKQHPDELPPRRSSTKELYMDTH